MHSNQDRHDSEARRIHQTLGGTTAFLRGYSAGELLLFVATGVVSLLAAAIAPPIATVPIMAGGVVLLGFLLVLHRVKPSYLWLTEWLLARLAWAFKDETYADGGEVSDVRHLSRVERIYPHAIERTDGALVGALAVEPANLALEDQEAWSNAVSSLAEFVNSGIEFPVQIYITNRELAQDEFVRAHRRRLRDADVRSRPILKRLVEHFVAENVDDAGDIDAAPIDVREYYLVTAVSDADVEGHGQASDSVLAYLAELPVVGRAFDRFQGSELTHAERRRLKEDELESRLQQLRREGSSLYRCSIDPVDSVELAELTREYWTGRQQSFEDPDAALCDFPLVHRDSMDPASPMDGDRPPSRSHDSSGDASDTSASSPEASEDRTDTDESSPSLDDVSARQQSWLVPATVDWESSYAVLDDETYVRTFWIQQFPQQPADGMFERLLLETELSVDVSIHLDPFDNDSAEDMIGDWISDMQVAQHDANSLRAEDLQADIDQGKRIRSLVRSNEASFLRTGVFLRLSADSKEALDTQTTRLRSIVKDAPSNSSLKVASRWQERGLVTVSPVGGNELGTDRMSTATNHAAGAMFPFSSNYLLMDGGVEYGLHGHNGSPVRIDPWRLETGYSELVVGMPGAGKTFGAILRHLRTMKRRGDTMLVMIDPVGGYRGLAEALDARTITVGGETRLNPLELRRSSESFLESATDASPLSAKKEEVYGHVQQFLELRGIDVGAETGVLSYAIDETYRRSDVDEGEIETHTPANSPTMTDLLEVFSAISESPDDHLQHDSASARELAAEYADQIAIALQPFRPGGAYENLSQPSEVEILEGDSDVVYVDLGEVEGSVSGIDQQTFLMQLLLSTIYQQTKAADRNVELAIDEAHYLFEDGANLDFLETAFRHQRHAGLRFVLLSQTAQEFYDSEQAERILGMCPIKVLHRLPDLDDETAEKMGLTREQRRYVRRADAGKQDLGYSQALVDVEEHGSYPIQIVGGVFERRVADYDPAAGKPTDRQTDAAASASRAFGRFVENQAGRRDAATGIPPDRADSILADHRDGEFLESADDLPDDLSTDGSPTDDQGLSGDGL